MHFNIFAHVIDIMNDSLFNLDDPNLKNEITYNLLRGRFCIVWAAPVCSTFSPLLELQFLDASSVSQLPVSNALVMGQ